MMQLELICQWEGRLNNARLRELFGIRTVRASEWMREFREDHPYWTNWNSTTRSYHATAEAYRSGKKADSGDAAQNTASLSQYLALVGLPYAAHASYGENAVPMVSTAFPDLSAPKPRIFAALNEAIRTHQAVEITYRSMREPNPHARVISPHNLVRAGRRWHVRAFCAKNQDFRDYALGRIVDVKALGLAAERLETDDKDWITYVPVRLVAHPDLTHDQGSLIRFEYFNDTAARTVSCRGSLVNYFMQDIRAAIDVKTQRPPEYQLAVSNVQEVAPWLFPV